MVLETQGQSNHRFWHLFGQLVTVAAPRGQIYQGHGQKRRLLTTGWSPLNFNRIYRNPLADGTPISIHFHDCSILLGFEHGSSMGVVWEYIYIYISPIYTYTHTHTYIYIYTHPLVIKHGNGWFTVYGWFSQPETTNYRVFTSLPRLMTPQHNHH